MKQIVFIHGGETFNSYDQFLSWLMGLELDLGRALRKKWSRTLGETLGEGFEVLAPGMPNAMNAKYVEWKILFAKVLPHLQDDVILIGHSLGGIFLAKYLATETMPVRVRATILIAAPHDEEDLGPLADFVLPDSLERMQTQAGGLHLFHSTDDSVVPYAHMARYQAELPTAHVHTLHGLDHCNQEEFPEVLELVRNL